MQFVGQFRIKRELEILIADINLGHNHNILFRAPSGYGKTRLALICLKLLENYGTGMYYLPSPDGLNLVPNFSRTRKIHIIDEAHKLKSQENLYPLMDCGEFTFFILTNESGELKEPLSNRCIQFIFDPYTLDDLTYMTACQLREFNFPEALTNEIGKKCIHPREVKIMCERLVPIFRAYKIPRTVEEMNEIISEFLRIDLDGLDESERNYLSFLRRIGGRASLDTLTNGTRIDKATILRDVEPKLIYLDKIRITSKGRVINES